MAPPKLTMPFRPTSGLKEKESSSENDETVVIVSGTPHNETPLSTQHMRQNIEGMRLNILVFSQVNNAQCSVISANTR